MGLGSLFKAVVNTAMLPVDIVRDTTEYALGAKVWDNRSHTRERIEEVADNLDSITEGKED